MRAIPGLLAWSVCLILNLTPPQFAGAGPLVVTDADVGVILQLPEVGDTTGLRDAVRHFQKGEYDTCLTLLKAAHKANPNLPPPQLMLGRLFFAAREFPQGRIALERAVRDDPKYPGTYLVLGDVALLEQRWADAGLQFEKAAALAAADPNRRPDFEKFRQQAQAGLAAVAEAREDWPAAVAALTQWLAAEPKNSAARQRLARALFAQDKILEAHQELVQAAKDDEKVDPPEVTVMWLYQRKNDPKKAEEWLARALEAAPKDKRVHLNAAGWLLENDRIDDAEKAVEEVLLLDPASTDVARFQGLIARSRKNYAEAERYFQAIYETSPGDFPATLQLSLVLIEQPEEAKQRRALQLAEINARQYPESSEALAALGWIYLRLGRLDDADRALSAAAKLGSLSSDAVYYLAHIHAERDRLDDVVRLLQTALDAPGRFSFRQEAQEWLAQLKRKSK